MTLAGPSSFGRRERMSRAVLLMVSLLCVGCDETKATGIGALSSFALARVAGPTPPAGALPTTRWTMTASVCGASPFEPARVRVDWAASKVESDVFLTDLKLSVVEPSEGLVVTVNPSVDIGGASLEAGAPWVDLATLAVHCERKTFRFPRQYEQRLRTLIQLKATGEGSADGPMVRATKVAP